MGVATFGDPSQTLTILNQGALDTKRSMSVLLHLKCTSAIPDEAQWIVGYTSMWDNTGFLMFTRNDVLYATFIPRSYSTDNWANMTVSANMTYNEWISVAATYDYHLGVAQLYINGEVAMEKSIGQQLLATHGRELRVGGVYDQLLFYGSMSCLQIYNRALSQEDVQNYLSECPLRKCQILECLGEVSTACN